MFEALGKGVGGVVEWRTDIREGVDIDSVRTALLSACPFYPAVVVHTRAGYGFRKLEMPLES